MIRKIFKLILIIILIVVSMFVSFGLAMFVSYLHFQIAHIPNALMYYEFSGLSAFFFDIGLIGLIIILFEKSRIERFRQAILAVSIIIVLSFVSMYMNFWVVSKDKIYVSSISTLGFNVKYDYKDVSNINIYLTDTRKRKSINSKPTGDSVLRVDLIVKGHKLDLIMIAPVNKKTENEEIKDLITTLKTKYGTSISVNKNGHNDHDKEIDYFLSN